MRYVGAFGGEDYAGCEDHDCKMGSSSALCLSAAERESEGERVFGWEGRGIRTFGFGDGCVGGE